MKKLLFLLIAAGGSASAIAQNSTPGYSADSLLSRWVLDINLLGGMAGQDLTTASSVANYPNALNMNTGQLKYKNGYSFGADAQLGFFFGKKRHFGFGTGIMFLQQHGDASLDNYHVEYQATDGAGNIYRQLVTGNVKEEVVSSMINIPVVLKYKNRFSKHWGFTADAGALVNMNMKNAYTTHASFDNEAIYKFVSNEEGGKTSVYDNSPIPDPNDWMITKAEFLKNNPTGNLQDYFNAKRALGINVGQGLQPTSRNGQMYYRAGSIGLLVQPSFNYFLSDKAALNFGVYYMYQPFKNQAQTGYRLTDGSGGYSSVLNSVTAANNEAYGVNLGVRFFLGKKHTPPVITSIDQRNPSLCGLCDGSILLHGLVAGSPVVVNYSLDGTSQNPYSGTVGTDGSVPITNLCAGSYTNIGAKVGKRTASGTPVTLADPPMTISSVTSTNPTATGACDGSILIQGLNPGQNVTVNFNLNGTPQGVYTGVVSTDKIITIPGLCEGSYNGFTVSTTKKCIATWTGSNTILTAPAPPPPPPAVVVDHIDISTPILFNFNKSTIHKSSYPVLDEAAKELKEGTDVYIMVDGYTDAVGSKGYNQKLSVRRADAVKKYLENKGARPRQIKIKGYGKTHPVKSNNTPEGRHENRRAVMDMEPNK